MGKIECDSIRSTVRRGVHTIGRRALDAASYVLFTTTTVTGTQLFARRTQAAVRETIRGGDVDQPYKGTGQPEYFDTSRQVSLYHPLKDKDPDGAIYLWVSNAADHARCSIHRQSQYDRHAKERLATVPVRVSINDEPQKIEGDHPSWPIAQGQTLRAWIGGDSFDDRNRRYGCATVTWRPAPAKAK